MNLYIKDISTREISRETFWKTCIEYAQPNINFSSNPRLRFTK